MEKINVTILADRLQKQHLRIELEKLSRRCGLFFASPKKKKEIAKLLSQHLITINQKSQLKSNNKSINHGKVDKLPSIISIDIGVKNFAYVHLTSNYQIIDWKKFSLDLDSFNPKNFFEKLQPIVHKTFLSKENVDAFIIERQCFRKRTSMNVQNVITIELMLYALLCDRVKDPLQVQSIHPFSVSNYLNTMLKVEEQNRYFHSKDFMTKWFQEQGKKTEVQKYLGKKTLSTILARNWINDHLHLCSGELAKYFLESKKKDDLADCLLQGFVYLESRRFSIMEAHKWIQYQGG
ncbi:ribonuclease H-like domain-containing protein [Gigaspora rosea]|uniref:Ribonuclease H-like domain-containing protein n=1 Tax=Gigaspora rosea TaxID=44941 RepID=A0A397VPD7_9GLOM|nr:ribonuclease H-like domain-containing protein [Gigaspora rosea]